MKIAIDISQIGYENTGVANYTKGLVKALLTADNENNYILFAYSLRKKGPIYKFIAELDKFKNKFTSRIFNFPQSAGNFIWNRLHIYPLEKLIGSVDIYHSSDWIQIPAGCKKVTTVHDLVVYKFPETSDPFIVQTQKKRLEHVKKECRIIICDSEATKQDLEELLKIDKERIKVVYPGIDEEFHNIKPGKSDLLEELNITTPYILSVGTNDPRKNLKNLITAFNKLKIPKPLLIIVSKGGWGEEIKVNENIKLIRKIDKKALSQLYAKAQMFVYPSFYEGFGLPVIEAFASGCPVITSNRGSLKEVAGNSAYIINPENINEIFTAMTDLFIDNNLRKELIKKGYQKAKNFTWQNSAEKIISIYKGL